MPIVDGAAAVGTSKKYARQDHVHPTDTTRLAAAAYTAADVLTKIKTVDGTGSGLDADLVKGYTPINKAGDTMTGLLVLSADPTAALGAATKQYVDQANKITVKSANATLTAVEQGIVEVSTGASVITITLPTAATSGLRYTIKKVDAGTGTVTITATGGQTIDGLATKVINARYASASVISNGAGWDVVSDGVVNPWGDNTTTNRSAFKAYNSASLALTAGTVTLIPYNTKIYDNLTEYNATTNYKFTAKSAGHYALTASINVPNMAANARIILYVYVNQVEITRMADTIVVAGNSTSNVNGSCIVSLNAGDYVEIMVNAVTTGFTIGGNTPANSFVEMTRIA